ncbi:CO/xanthine dehydrogenase Mo-binding subunit [Streptomyces sp. SAI-126]
MGTAAAIDNALIHTTGVRPRKLPLTPDRLLTGIRERGGF